MCWLALDWEATHLSFSPFFLLMMTTAAMMAARTMTTAATVEAMMMMRGKTSSSFGVTLWAPDTVVDTEIKIMEREIIRTNNPICKVQSCVSSYMLQIRFDCLSIFTGCPQKVGFTNLDIVQLFIQSIFKTQEKQIQITTSALNSTFCFYSMHFQSRAIV